MNPPPIIPTRQDLARLLFHGTGAELGVAAGAFSACMLESSGITTLYAIDRWTDHHDLREYFKACHQLRRLAGAAFVLRMTFAEACPLFPAEHFDFLYIDGYAHTGQEGGQTLHDWWPKLKPGGIFAGHDYSPQYPLTMQAVDQFAAAHGLTLHLTTEDKLPSWWCHKLP